MGFNTLVVNNDPKILVINQSKVLIIITKGIITKSGISQYITILVSKTNDKFVNKSTNF